MPTPYSNNDSDFIVSTGSSPASEYITSGEILEQLQQRYENIKITNPMTSTQNRRIQLNIIGLYSAVHNEYDDAKQRIVEADGFFDLFEQFADTIVEQCVDASYPTGEFNDLVGGLRNLRPMLALYILETKPDDFFENTGTFKSDLEIIGEYAQERGLDSVESIQAELSVYDSDSTEWDDDDATTRQKAVAKVLTLAGVEGVPPASEIPDTLTIESIRKARENTSGELQYAQLLYDHRLPAAIYDTYELADLETWHDCGLDPTNITGSHCDACGENLFEVVMADGETKWLSPSGPAIGDDSEQVWINEGRNTPGSGLFCNSCVERINTEAQFAFVDGDSAYRFAARQSWVVFAEDTIPDNVYRVADTIAWLKTAGSPEVKANTVDGFCTGPTLASEMRSRCEAVYEDGEGFLNDGHVMLKKHDGIGGTTYELILDMTDWPSVDEVKGLATGELQNV
jgi:hypothetical protein